jgi:hypothetical protein
VPGVPNWLPRLWRLLNSLGTVHFLWSIGGGAVVGVIARPVTNLPVGWIVTLGIGTAALMLAAFLTWGRRGHEHEIDPLRTILERERQTPKVEVVAEWGEFHVESARPKLTNVLMVRNHSIFPIGFESAVEGSLTWGGKPLRLSPTLTTHPDRPLNPEESARLVLEQWLTGDEKERLERLFHNEPPGTKEVLRWSTMTIWMVIHDPEGRQRRPLPVRNWTSEFSAPDQGEQPT